MKDIRKNNIKKNHIVILITYFSILIISLLGWIFADLIEEYLISLGLIFVKNLIWPLSFITNMITFCFGTQIIIKILTGGNNNNLKTQKRMFKIYCLSTIFGIIVFVLFMINLI